jgi:hypothetical protein
VDKSEDSDDEVEETAAGTAKVERTNAPTDEPGADPSGEHARMLVVGLSELK